MPGPTIPNPRFLVFYKFGSSCVIPSRHIVIKLQRLKAYTMLTTENRHTRHLGMEIVILLGPSVGP